MLASYEEGEESIYVAQGIFAFEKMFREMEAELSEGRDWLVGDFSLADINAMPFVARLDYLTLLDIWTAERPRVRAWWARARSRPSFANAISERLKPEQRTAMAVSGARIKPRLSERWQEITRGALHAAA
jgi:glutathione S-transferase